MKAVALSIVSLFLAVATMAQPQLPSAKPGPEAKRLEIQSGHWKWSENSVETPFGSAGKAAYTSEVSMILGGLYLEEKGTGTTPAGPFSWLWLATYDSEKGRYVSYNFDTDQSTKPWKGEHGTGQVEGNTWTWTWKQEVKGRSYHCRAVNVYSAEGKTMTYEWSYSEDGKMWKPWVKGEGTKVGAARSK